MYHLKLIIRKILLRPFIPAISVLGLTIGFIATVLVSNWLRNEFSYDKFNKSERIYRLTVEINNEKTGFHWDFARSAFLWLKNIKKEVPGIESMVRFNRIPSGIVKVNDKLWYDELFSADANFPDFFSLRFIKGNPENCLTQPQQVIISKSAAQKYFGNSDPLGKPLFLYCSQCQERKSYIVTGIFEDFPANSHVHCNIVTSLGKPDEDLVWAYYYVTLNKNVSPNKILAGFKSFSAKYRNKDDEAILTPHLQKITDIHLKSSKERELEINGSMKQVYVVSGLALLLLVITLFNYFNLQYISLLKEFKSLRIFKFAGAKSRHIYGYKITESLLYSFLSACFALLIVQLIYSKFNILMGKQPGAGISLYYSDTAICLLSLMTISVLISIFPYILLKASSFFKSAERSSTLMPSSYISKIGARSKVLKIFVGAQYVLTFLLLVAVIIVNSQLNFFMNNRLGNEQEKLININKIPCQVANKFHLFKEELLKNPLIKDVTCSMETPGEEIMDMVGFKTSGISEENAKKLIYLSPVDDNFFSFYRIKLVAGKSFPKFNGVDSSANSYILNEKAVKYLGWKNEEAIGKPFKLNIEYFAKELGHIVGVVSDFQPSSMKNEIKPYIYLQKSVWLFEAQVKYDTKQQEKCLSVIKDTWKRIYPDFPFEFEYVEDLYSKVYTNEIQLKNLSFILSVLASLLSAIGLLGITGLVYEAKTKEIGIRKVNGAKIVEILNWLIADIIVVVVVAIFIAVPLAYYFVSKWLDNYVYKTDLSPWIFIAGGLILIGIALLTVIWQTWKAATRNPVEALRYE